MFNIIVDGLAMLIKKAQRQGMIRGLVPNLVGGGLAILQYADDTILLLGDNLENSTNLRCTLCIFEQVFGLKINFHLSGIYCLEDAIIR